ncbi:thiamine-phosphate synthase family protein [Staphylothermus hellenicus]|uniref:Phosphomethylpyrimidine kinase n=1 Tax=Staphylothermus hellenicus (strain DSM 12710 / JCM 10830 / BK20S6-10-b1 / P8) TaxID=591019 RepID=D7D8S3_STAHD|nr:thiamine-phosphate synthase family protein [Staphylothermus hellenicus]ADI32169.1 Phosphomethylpyrimidine kinase [Staphylothermus hellenicus DSM 12710]
MLLQEIAARIIIPPLKGLLIHSLSKEGFSQRRIAKLLGITQPQVHKYLSKPEEYYYNLLLSHGFDIDKISSYLNIILYTALKEEQLKLVLLMSSIVNDLSMEYLCRIKHGARDYCRGTMIVDPFIEHYKSFISTLLSKYNLSKLIPEVGSNIVFSPHKPKDISDIIGLSGRILRVGGGIKAVGEPIYGGSRHLSRILLIATKYNEKYRAAMNIVYDKYILDKLADKNYKVMESGPHKTLEEFWLNIEKTLKEKPQIIGDKGGYGLEPVIYIFAENLSKLEEIIRIILYD